MHQLIITKLGILNLTDSRHTRPAQPATALAARRSHITPAGNPVTKPLVKYCTSFKMPGHDFKS